MQEIIKAINERGGGLVIILVVIIMALAGLQRQHNDDVKEIQNDAQKRSQAVTEGLHELDKRITVLEHE